MKARLSNRIDTNDALQFSAKEAERSAKELTIVNEKLTKQIQENEAEMQSLIKRHENEINQFTDKAMPAVHAIRMHLGLAPMRCSNDRLIFLSESLSEIQKHLDTEDHISFKKGREIEKSVKMNIF